MVWSMGAPPAEQPLLSVVTPVLNGASHIGGSLSSVRALALAGVSVEHIIMDGGSSDGTLEFVGRERRRPGSPITHVVSEWDSGQADAINRGYKLASGRFLGWLNADDVYETKAFLDFTERLARSKADVVLGRCEFVDQTGRSVFRPVPPNPVTPGSLLRLLSGWYAGRSIVQPEAFVSAEAYGRHGKLRRDLHYTMDHEYWLRLAAEGASFEQHQLIIAKQLAHPGQKTADNARVVREQLAYSKEYAARRDVLLDTEQDAVDQELGFLEDKVRAFDRLSLVIGGVWAGAEPVRRTESDAYALAHLARVVRRPERVLCVGLTSQEVVGVSAALRPVCAPVIARDVPGVAEVFDAVVASPVAGGSGRWLDELVQTAKVHGHICVYGMPDATRIRSLKTSIERELSNRLTWNRASLVAPGSDMEWVSRLTGKCLSGAGQIERAAVEVLQVFRYGEPAHHPLLGLAQMLGVESDKQAWLSGVFERK